MSKLLFKILLVVLGKKKRPASWRRIVCKSFMKPDYILLPPPDMTGIITTTTIMTAVKWRLIDVIVTLFIGSMANECTNYIQTKKELLIIF
jgi:hypothetical protein